MLLLRTHNAENNQLHFTEGLAWYDDTCYGARKFPPNQPVYIISRQSLCQPTSTGYSSKFSGHHRVMLDRFEQTSAIHTVASRIARIPVPVPIRGIASIPTYPYLSGIG